MKIGNLTGMKKEMIVGMGGGEYLPQKAYENRFYIATREDRILAIEGKALIENEEKNGSNLQAKVTTYDDDTVLELPYIYYPGYEIMLDGMHIKSFETENGMLGIKMPKNENSLLEIKYSGSSIAKSSILVSIVGVFGTIIYLIINNKKREEI